MRDLPYIGYYSLLIGTILCSCPLQSPTGLIGAVGAVGSEKEKKLRVSESGCISSKVTTVCFTKIDGSF